MKGALNTRRYLGLPEHWPSRAMSIYRESKPFNHDGYSVSIRGFLSTPAVGSTVHGMQGLTCAQICVMDPRLPQYRNRPTQSLCHVVKDPNSKWALLDKFIVRQGLCVLFPRAVDRGRYFQDDKGSKTRGTKGGWLVVKYIRGRDCSETAIFQQIIRR